MPQNIHIKVKNRDHHSRIDRFLADQIKDYTRSYLQKRIDAGDVRVDEKICHKRGYKLSTGEQITVQIPDPVKWDILPRDIPLDILYEDKAILVINKPAGMPVHPGAGHYSDTLVNALMNYCGDNLSSINGIERPGIVHRLDKDTSGLLVVAKNDAAHQSLSGQFSQKTAGRIYEALIWLAPGEIEGRIETLINRDPKNRKKMAVSNEGRKAVTNYKIIKKYTFCSHLQLNLETGRTHQIRVHMKFIGTPIIGDETYGGGKSFLNRIQVMDRKFAGHLLAGIPSFLLHARKLKIIHPITDKEMYFEKEIPDYFKKAIEKLENREKTIFQ